MKKKLTVLILTLFVFFQTPTLRSWALSGGEVQPQKIGELEIYTLLDGVFPAPEGWLLDTRVPEDQRIINTENTVGYVNVFLLKLDGKTVLFDSGLGEGEGGKLLQALSSMNLSADNIDAVVITHYHSDHVGGLLNSQGRPVFPKAEIYISETEVKAYKTKPELAFLESYADRMKIFAPNTEILPGVMAVSAPGHTIGNTTFRIKRGGDQLLLVSDLVHFTHYQFANPNLTVIFDENPELAIAARKSVFDQASEEKIPIAGPHIDYPGIVTIEKDGAGYKFSFPGQE